MVPEIVILALLNAGPKHGYDIKKHVEHILQRRTKLNTNLLYPALHRLERMQAVERTKQEQQGRPNKYVYRITSRGSELFQEIIQEFDEATAAKEDEFLVRLAFFDLMDGYTRVRILDQRKRELERQLANRRSIRTEYAEEYNSPWIERIMSFGERRIADEIEWMKELERLADEESRNKANQE